MVRTRNAIHQTTTRWIGHPASQSDLPDQPAGAPGRHHGGEHCRLTRHDRDEDKPHDRASERQQPDAGRPPRDERERSSSGGQGRDVRPAAPERHRPLEADHGPQESRDHQRAVKRDERRGRWQRPAEPDQPARERTEQRQHAERHEGKTRTVAPPEASLGAWRAPAGRYLQPSCSRAASDIIDGSHGGSHTSSTLTEVAPGT